MTVEELIEEFEEKLHRFALGLTRDSSRADDLVQETFIRTMGHLALLGQLAGPQRSAWLYRVLRNLFLDQQLAARREEALFERFALDISVPAYFAQEDTLSAILDEVPDRYREIVEKRFIFGLTSEEIGQELGIPSATVRSRLHLAIQHLRAHKAQFM